MPSPDTSLTLPLIALESTPAGEPPAGLYSAPAEERWFIAELLYRIGLRLTEQSLTPSRRRGLLRLMWGLQRFPIVTPGLSIGVSWSGMESHRYIEATSACLRFTFCHTRLEYFVGSHQLFQYGAILLRGPARQQFLQGLAPEFYGISEAGKDLYVEDLSEGDLVDRPPMLASHARVDADGEA